MVSIVLVNFNGKHYTLQCLESIHRYLDKNLYEVIVVDNGSIESCDDDIKRFYPKTRTIQLSENKGFGSANNAGAAIATGEFLFFLNNDTVLTHDCLTPLIMALKKNNHVGAIGPKLFNEDGSFQLSTGTFPTIHTEWFTRRAQRINRSGISHLVRKQELKEAVKSEVDWVSGAALFVRTSVFREVGCFDERFFMYFEDADLCCRISEKGNKIWYFPQTTLIHFGGRSYESKDSRISIEYRRSQLHYYRKHNSTSEYVVLMVYLFFKAVVAFLRTTDRPFAIELLRLLQGRI